MKLNKTAAAIGLAAATASILSLTAPAANAATTQPHNLDSTDTITSTIHNNTTDYRLGNAYFHAAGGRWSGTDPNTAPVVDPGGSMTFAEIGDGNSIDGVGVKFNYEVLQKATDGSWQPTGYWVHGNNQESLGGWSSHYYMYKGDPAEGGKLDNQAPFKVSTTDDHQENATMTFDLSEMPRTVVTDPGRQRELLDDHCGKGACDFQGSTTQVVHGAPVQVGYAFDNTSYTVTNEHAVAWSKTVTEENSLTVSSATGIELSKIVSETVTLEYGHTWSNSHTFSETDTLQVPPRTTGWFTLAPEYNRVTGDFTIVADGTAYDIPNATFDFPTGNGVLTANYQPDSPGSAVHQQVVRTVQLKK